MAAVSSPSFPRCTGSYGACHRGAGSALNRHLLICSRSHAPHGGADCIIADLCRELPKRGWRVTLGLTKGARYDNPQHYLDVLGADLPARIIDGSLGTRWSRVAAIRRMIRETHPGIVLSMRVFDAYEAVAHEKSEDGPRLAVGLRVLEAPYLADLAMLNSQVDACITSGRLLADLAVRIGGIEMDRVASVGGGVKPPVCPHKRRDPALPLRLLYAGRLDQTQKRVMDIPEFIDDLERRGVPFELAIAGAGPAEDELRARLASRVKHGQVRFLGWLDQAELYADIYPATDCFIHFAAWEGMTIAPREAMANGAVPVLSRFAGLRREGLFRDGENALTFDVGDVGSAAACVARLHADRALLDRLSQQAARSQVGEYSATGAIDAWAQALERCLGQPTKRHTWQALPDRSRGRLQRLGIPEALQDVFRRVLRRPVRHASPGSEWPTSSGLLDARQIDAIKTAAKELDQS